MSNSELIYFKTNIIIALTYTGYSINSDVFPDFFLCVIFTKQFKNGQSVFLLLLQSVWYTPDGQRKDCQC